jgi:hypothetical protein
LVRYFAVEKIKILNFKHSQHILKSNIHDSYLNAYFHLKSKITETDIAVAVYDSPKQEYVC